jgi:hypothetical protein
MALATNTILSSMEFAKRFCFNRPLGIGNFLEPAKTSANLVMQAILSPPFKWFWNNEEWTFTCNPIPLTASPTGNLSITSGVLTLNLVTAIGVQQVVLLSGFTAASTLNGQSGVVLTNTGSVVTVQVNLPNLTATASTGGLVTAANTQDYSLLIPEFSHIEHASVLDISRSPNKWIELEVKSNLALESNTARPQFVEPHIEDANGNIQFRIMPAPNLAYPVSLHIQKVAPLVTSLNQTWAPIPDFMSYVYNYGFLALMLTFSDDPRAQMASQRFVSHLLGRASGLTAVERNIFLNRWNDLTQLENLEMSQGVQARAQG